ncbi:MAG: hypothetical protein ACLGPL_09395 [Acidobacteriota bacterium]
MAREIRKKIIEAESALEDGGGDPFDKMLEEQMEAEFERSSSQSMTSLDMPAETSSSNFFDEPLDGPDDSDRGFSLDEFEAKVDLPDPSPPPVPEDDAKEEDSEEKAKERPRRRIALNKAAIAGACGLLLLTSVGFGIWAWLHREPAPVPEPVTIIRHDIEVPLYQESLDFFVLAESQEEKNILSMTIEFEFRNYSKLKNFRSDNVLVRDTVFQFLGSRHPVRNSSKEWQKIVQKELSAHLEATLPQSQADSMRITRMEKL